MRLDSFVKRKRDISIVFASLQLGSSLYRLAWSWCCCSAIHAGITFIVVGIPGSCLPVAREIEDTSRSLQQVKNPALLSPSVDEGVPHGTGVAQTSGVNTGVGVTSVGCVDWVRDGHEHRKGEADALGREY